MGMVITSKLNSTVANTISPIAFTISMVNATRCLDIFILLYHYVNNQVGRLRIEFTIPLVKFISIGVNDFLSWVGLYKNS